MIILGVLYVIPLLLKKVVYFWTGSLTGSSVYIWGELVALPIHPANALWGKLYSGHPNQTEILSSPPLFESISLVKKKKRKKKSPLDFCLESLPDLWELCTEERTAVDEGKVEREVWIKQCPESRLQINSLIFSLTSHSRPPLLMLTVSPEPIRSAFTSTASPFLLAALSSVYFLSMFLLLIFFF